MLVLIFHICSSYLRWLTRMFEGGCVLWVRFRRPCQFLKCIAFVCAADRWQKCSSVASRACVCGYANACSQKRAAYGPTPTVWK
jgi:hypothetical protein